MRCEICTRINGVWVYDWFEVTDKPERDLMRDAPAGCHPGHEDDWQDSEVEARWDRDAEKRDRYDDIDPVYGRDV